MRRHLKRLTVGLLLGCSIFFFVGGPGEISSRSVQRAWDLGHLVFFLAATAAWLTWSGKSIPGSAARSWVVVLLAVNLLGVSIEALQAVLGRSASIHDLLLDNVGTILALALHGYLRKLIVGWKMTTVCGLSLALLSWALAPLVVALTDEWLARRAFPVLADFETPFELSRWECECECEIQRSVVRYGDGAMRVSFSTERYSTVGLVYFPGDWSEMTTFTVSVFNPDSTSLRLHSRVHDEWHEDHGRRYDDRFNTVFNIEPGWNDLTVPVSEIVAGPEGRELNLERVEGLSFFTVELKQPRTIVIDQVELR